MAQRTELQSEAVPANAESEPEVAIQETRLDRSPRDLVRLLMDVKRTGDLWAGNCLAALDRELGVSGSPFEMDELACMPRQASNPVVCLRVSFIAVRLQLLVPG